MKSSLDISNFLKVISSLSHSIWFHYFMANRWEKMETVTGFIFLGSKITAGGDCSHESKRRLLLRRKAITSLDRVLKSRDITLLTKVHVVKAYGFPRSRVCMWELDHKEGWVLKNWWFWIVVQRRLLTVPWTAKEIKPGNPKGSQPWILIGRADAEAEAPILWPPDAKDDSLEKILMVRKVAGMRRR